jgi:hypothetical protein
MKPLNYQTFNYETFAILLELDLLCFLLSMFFKSTKAVESGVDVLSGSKSVSPCFLDACTAAPTVSQHQ